MANMAGNKAGKKKQVQVTFLTVIRRIEQVGKGRMKLEI